MWLTVPPPSMPCWRCQAAMSMGRPPSEPWPYELQLAALITCLQTAASTNSHYMTCRDFVQLTVACHHMCPTGPGGYFCTPQCRLAHHMPRYSREKLPGGLQVQMSLAMYRASCRVLALNRLATEAVEIAVLEQDQAAQTPARKRPRNNTVTEFHESQ